MIAAVTGIRSKDTVIWEVILAFRRFLHREAHEELQALARQLYIAISASNVDAVWLALTSTNGQLDGMSFLKESQWNIDTNVNIILNTAGV
jgi:hypothetical protein